MTTPSPLPAPAPPTTRFLLDTNILLRLSDATSPVHPLIVEALRRLTTAGHQLCITPQNLIEFWNVATRPQDRNGFGLTPAQAARRVQLLQGQFHLLEEPPALFPVWQQAAERVGVSGVQVHDARLVAFMVVHQVMHILTFNGRDFARFSGFAGALITVNPVDV